MPRRDHSISLAEAVTLTTNARNAQLLPVHAWRYDRSIIDAILAQPGTEGIRFYLGVTSTYMPTLVLVGTDAQDRDIASGVIGEEGEYCPPYCDTGSVLLTGSTG